MKTFKKITSIILTTMIVASVFYFSSCQKEKSCSPSNSLLETLLQKTNGGEQATSINSINALVGATQDKVNPMVFPPTAHMYGSSYGVWSSEWWKWAMELPPVTNHPFNDDPGFDITMGQSGNVWFLASVFGTATRSCTIPAGKALFAGILNAEASDLEGLGNTFTERLATATWLADHIVPSSLSCTVDGLPVNLSSYQFVSPEFSFNAPTPWIYGATGGTGTSVADGYYVMIKPLSPGTHTLQFTGAFHFTLEDDGFDFDASLDMTYNITQQ